MNHNDTESLRQWFLENRRDLPWRTNSHPYAVWVSEVMLQQTQVSVVIPYFERWMQRFPDIPALAAAPLEAIIKEWEGLGYYSRARHLHEGARYVAAHHNGILPSSTEELKKIKGLGSYTIGAIQSFAFHQRQAAVDGNVLRVLARYYGIFDDITQSKTVKNIQKKAQALLPEKSPWEITEGLIELGATHCSRTPKCMECPLKKGCTAYIQGKAMELPYRSPRKPTTPLFRAVAIIQYKDSFLVNKGTKGRIMSDLYEFPYFEYESPEIDIYDVSKKTKDMLGIKADWKCALEIEKHSFTRFRATLYPHLYTVHMAPKIQGHQWLTVEDMHKAPFSSGHKRILSQLRSR